MTALPWLHDTLAPQTGLDPSRVLDLLGIVCVVALASLISAWCDSAAAMAPAPAEGDSL